MFLHALKGLLRQTLAVCMITLPSHFFEPTFMRKIFHICDNVIAFEAFNGKNENQCLCVFKH
jgi:elongator complex protein 4